MIDAYAWTTPNGFKALIALEELALPYQLHWVDITKGEQTRPEYLAINPNNKIPAIVDRDAPGGPRTIFESGAVLLYLAEKAGRLMPTETAARYQALEWLFFGAGGPGPMIGQFGYWVHFAKEKNPPAIERYTAEAHRLLRVLDGRLGASPYLAGDEYTVADIMNVTWARAPRRFGVDLDGYRNLSRWIADIEARPAVARALAMTPTPAA
jgi:GSH-dependent disulfide-bond oxidoreductase